MTDRRFAIMQGEDDVADQFLTTPRRPPLRVTLANPRESGIIEFSRPYVKEILMK